MNAHPITSPQFVPAPPATRAAAPAGRALPTIRDALAYMWQRWNDRTDEQRAFDAIGHLSEHVLKDIGAPNQLLANARERREARQLQWINVELP